MLGTAAVVLPPGPNSLYVLSVAARRRLAAGLATLVGGAFVAFSVKLATSSPS